MLQRISQSIGQSRANILKRLGEIKQMIVKYEMDEINARLVKENEKQIVKNVIDTVMNSGVSPEEKINQMRDILDVVQDSEERNDKIHKLSPTKINKLKQIVNTIKIKEIHTHSPLQNKQQENSNQNNWICSEQDRLMQKLKELRAGLEDQNQQMFNQTEKQEYYKQIQRLTNYNTISTPSTKEIQSKPRSILKEALDNVRKYKTKKRKKRRDLTSSDEDDYERFKINSYDYDGNQLSDNQNNYFQRRDWRKSQQNEELSYSSSSLDNSQDAIQKKWKSKSRFSTQDEQLLNQRKSSKKFLQSQKHSPSIINEFNSNNALLSSNNLNSYQSNRKQNSSSNQQIPFQSEKSHPSNKLIKNKIKSKQSIQNNQSILYTQSENGQQQENAFSFRNKDEQNFDPKKNQLKRQSQKHINSYKSFSKSNLPGNNDDEDYDLPDSCSQSAFKMSLNQRISEFHKKQSSYNLFITSKQRAKMNENIRNRIMVSPGSAFGIDFDQSNSKQDQIQQRYIKQQREIGELVKLVAGKKGWGAPQLKRRAVFSLNQVTDDYTKE